MSATIPKISFGFLFVGCQTNRKNSPIYLINQLRLAGVFFFLGRRNSHAFVNRSFSHPKKIDNAPSGFSVSSFCFFLPFPTTTVSCAKKNCNSIWLWFEDSLKNVRKRTTFMSLRLEISRKLVKIMEPNEFVAFVGCKCQRRVWIGENVRNANGICECKVCGKVAPCISTHEYWVLESSSFPAWPIHRRWLLLKNCSLNLTANQHQLRKVLMDEFADYIVINHNL